MSVLRPMTTDDVEAVLAVQEPGAVSSLASVFPQDRYPFPRAELRERWLREVADQVTNCFVIVADGEAAGFAAVREEKLVHFGTAIERWGTGLAGTALTELHDILAEAGVGSAWLRVFEANGRARRFYEKHGWREAGERTTSSFEPHPVLLRYERDLDTAPAGSDAAVRADEVAQGGRR